MNQSKLRKIVSSFSGNLIERSKNHVPATLHNTNSTIDDFLEDGQRFPISSVNDYYFKLLIQIETAENKDPAKKETAKKITGKKILLELVVEQKDGLK